MSSWWGPYRRRAFVTSYKVHPFVGMFDAGYTWTPQETEVAQVLELSLPDLRRGFESKRLLRKGVPIKTPTYTVDGHLVWGATARIVENLLGRLEPVLDVLVDRHVHQVPHSVQEPS